MAHIFFKKLENRKNTQTFFGAIDQFAGEWGFSPSSSNWTTSNYPVSRFTPYYGAPSPRWPIESIAWKQPRFPIFPIDFPVPLYGISPSPWNPIGFPKWQNPIFPFEPPVLLYGISPSPVGPIDIPYVPSPINPIGPIVTYYGITTPSTIIDYPTATLPIDTAYPGPGIERIDDWILLPEKPVIKPNPYKPPWRNPINDPEPIPPPRVIAYYGIKEPIPPPRVIAYYGIQPLGADVIY